MKKIYILFVICIAVALGGCTTKKQTADGLVSKTKSDFDESQDQNYWERREICKSGSGYYFICNRLLYYMDEKQMEPILLCSSSNCKHEDEACNAYIEDDMPLLFDAEDAIYVMTAKRNETWDVYLYRISKDGTQREEVGYIYSAEPKNYFYWDFMLVQNQYLYRIGYENASPKFVRYSLDNGKEEEVFDFAGMLESSVAGIQGYEYGIYFNVDWKASKDEEKYHMDIYRYNENTKATELVTENIACSEYVLIDENTIVYEKIDFSLWCRDLKTGKEVQWRKCSSEEPGLLSFDGKYIYYYTDYKDSNHIVEVYDTDGNKVDEVDMQGAEYYGGDENYIFGRKYVESGNVTIGHYFVYYDKSQMGTGKGEWKPCGKIPSE